MSSRTVVITAFTAVPTKITWSVDSVAFFVTPDGSATAPQPYDAHMIYPCNDHPRDKVDPRERDHDVTGDDDPGPKKPVEEVDQRDLREGLAFAASGQRLVHDQSRVANE